MSDARHSTPAEPLFRASKRRKIFRRRDESPEATKRDMPVNVLETTAVDEEQPMPAALGLANSHDEPPQLGSLLRQRKPVSRRGGIAFSNSSSANQDALMPSSDLALITDDKPNAIEQASRRFTVQTGQIAEVHDKHMAAFIEAKINRMRSGAPSNTSDQPSTSSPSTHAHSHAPRTQAVRQRQPAVVGKLQEIDLGPSAALKNIALTEAATRRLQGVDDTEEQKRPPEKVLLGRDGKPRRRRYRRPSDALKRDAIVEAVLRESKLDIYEPPLPPPVSNTHNTTATANATSTSTTTTYPNINPDNDEAADDRFAEEFRREFMDALASRHAARRHAAPPASGPSGAKKAEEKVSRGPKLGGSRSARAAMKAAEERDKAAGVVKKR